MGEALLLLALPVSIWCAFKVRREDAEMRHMWLYAVATGVVAVGVAWVSGFGLFGLVFFPVGFVLAVADSFFKIFEWWPF